LIEVAESDLPAFGESFPASLHCWEEQQIPCGNDRQKDKGKRNDESKSGSFAALGMAGLLGFGRKGKCNSKNRLADG
jgi:hypothetical protein